MKKSICLLALAIMLSAVVAPAFAGGGQNTNTHQGDLGQGEIEQHQIQNN